MDKKYLIISGLVLLAVIFIAGIVFSPSGYVIEQKPSMGYACMKLGTGIERCDGSSSYWKENKFDSDDLCEKARDEDDKPCNVYDCSCKRLRE